MDHWPPRHSFSPITIRDLRERQGCDRLLLLSSTRMKSLCAKYALDKMELVLLFTAETVDKFGRIAD